MPCSQRPRRRGEPADPVGLQEVGDARGRHRRARPAQGPGRRDRRPVRRPDQRGNPRDLPGAQRRAVDSPPPTSTSDSELLSAKANERFLAQLNSWIEQSRKFEGQQMSPETARAIHLLKLRIAMPPPKDPAKLAELTQIATQHGRHVRLGQVLHRAKATPKTAASSASWRTCCAATATTTSSSTPGRAGTPSPSRCARTTRASSNWSTRARKRHGLRRHRRDVALGLRHDAGRDRRRNRPPVGPGQAAVRAAALLHPHQAGGEVRRRQGRRSPAACCPRT